jgi:hypothetical protein
VFPAISPPRPHAPAKVLEIFSSGFGPTEESTAPGLVISGADQASNPVSVTVGGQSVTILWAGLAAAGLWQIQYPASLHFGRRKPCGPCVRERSKQPNRCYTYRNRLSDDCTTVRYREPKQYQRSKAGA